MYSARFTACHVLLLGAIGLRGSVVLAVWLLEHVHYPSALAFYWVTCATGQWSCAVSAIAASADFCAVLRPVWQWELDNNNQSTSRCA